MVLFSPSALEAQTTSAVVSGAVTDSQGAALPGATVTLTSRTQGNVLTATTDAEGRYVLPVVRPDSYTLKITMQGFKTAERTNVVVSANDRFSSGSIALEVGGIEESVSVSSRVSELQVESGERSFTLESEALKNIANNGRNVFNFANLVPGALTQNTSGVENAQVSAFTVNGQRPNSNNMTIDGVANIDTGDNGGNMAQTNIDAVAEFKVLTNAYQAEYGRAVGGQLQVVTKSGQQSFHGSGYWYGRRSDWNANNWANKRAAAPPPVGGGALIEPAKASRNDYGYTLGGPIYIPGVFNEDKKKLFFFWSQEFQRRTDPVAPREGRVPTALERTGDFSKSVDASGNPFPYIRDYQTGLPCNASNTSGCFADGGVLGKIPASRLYAPGINALNIYPSPNFTAGSGINFTSQNPNEAPVRQDLLRLDFQASDQWRFTGRYMKTKEEVLQAYGTTWAGNGSDHLPMPVLWIHPGSNYMLSATGILSPSMSLEVSFGRAANSLDYELQAENLFRSAAGVSAMPLLFPDAVQADYIPDFRFRGGRTGNAGFYQTDRGPFTNKNITYDALANLSKVAGSHSMKFGVYFQHSYKPQSIFASFNSQINFIDDSNNPFDTGYGYANAATGVFNTYTQASKFAIPDWKYKNLEWYAQDNWKVSRKLTLDYGVRFYYITPQWDTSLQASNFLPDEFDFANAANLYRPVCIGTYPCSGANRRGMDPRLVSAGVSPTAANTVESRFIGRLTPDSNRFNGAYQAGQGINDELQDGNAFKISPRFGFTYDISGKGETILRGGAGVFYDRPQGNMVFDMISNAPGVLNSTITWGRLQDLGSGGTGTDPNAVLSLNPTAYDFKPPKTYQWNVGIQHKLWYNLIADVAYVGSSNKDLLRQSQINAVPRGARYLPENQDPTLAPSTVPGATALPDNLLRPYQGYGNIRMWDYSGFSNYHALQLGLNRRFENGVGFGAFYVWSKSLTIANDDFAAGIPNVSEEEAKRVDYSYSNFDRPHNFVLNFIYQTPKVADGVAGILLNDWQLSGIYRWTSGRPYAINYSIPGIGAANLVGNDGNPNARIVVKDGCDPGGGWSDDPYKQIDTSCFLPPQVGSDGAESARFFLWNPPIVNLDLSVSKVIPVGKRVRMEVRLDMFNALNHTQFISVNNTVNFASLTDATITNLPHDANGNLIRNNGFGSVNVVAPPRTLQLVTRLTF
ncbi:MAG: carboxypeptidase regulatory-like domain-containing protein [Burkholderiales bacterium]